MNSSILERIEELTSLLNGKIKYLEEVNQGIYFEDREHTFNDGKICAFTEALDDLECLKERINKDV